MPASSRLYRVGSETGRRRGRNEGGTGMESVEGRRQHVVGDGAGTVRRNGALPSVLLRGHQRETRGKGAIDDAMVALLQPFSR